MNLRALSLAAVVWMPFVLGACGDDPPKSYATYQDCFDDETQVGMVVTADAIVACCIDHPIAGKSPACGDTKPDCINYLTANLNQTSASTTEVSDSCGAYITQRQNPPQN